MDRQIPFSVERIEVMKMYLLANFVMFITASLSRGGRLAKPTKALVAAWIEEGIGRSTSL